MKILSDCVVEAWTSTQTLQEKLGEFEPQLAVEYRRIVDFLWQDYTDLLCSLNAMLERNNIAMEVVDIHYDREMLEGEVVTFGRVVPDEFLMRLL